MNQRAGEEANNDANKTTDATSEPANNGGQTGVLYASSLQRSRGHHCALQTRASLVAFTPRTGALFVAVSGNSGTTDHFLFTQTYN